MKIYGTRLSQQPDQTAATSTALASESSEQTTELGQSPSAVVDLSPQAVQLSKEGPGQQNSVIKPHDNVFGQDDSGSVIKPHGNVGHP
jgi:hypothetical protein